jgi:peptidoglycan hydrolase-like protein with peptidoglycan-binding domain
MRSRVRDASSGGAPRRRRIIPVALGLLAVAALIGWRATISHSTPQQAATGPAGTASATVVRTDVLAQQQVPGTLGYLTTPPVLNQLPGVLTAVPSPGAVIRRGEQLYAVNGQPVTLFYGHQPAWRTLILGVSDGADVRELESNLVAVGADPQHWVTVDDQFTAATAAAVTRWQHALGLPETGAVALGQIVFAPGPVRVAADLTGLGADLQPGTAVAATTIATPAVTVNLDPAYQALIHPGSPVTVTLPGGTTLPGHVTAVSTVATLAVTDNSGSAAAGPPAATIPVTIQLDHPRAAGHLDQAPVQVSIITQQARNVLAVPVTALLARAGGGYDVEIMTGTGIRRVPVTVGLFDDTSGLVQVQGPSALRAGITVEVPAP